MPRLLKIAFGVACAGLFAWLIARHFDRQAVWAALSGARPVWICTAVAVFFLGYALRVARWRLMLSDGNPGLTWGRAFGPFMAATAANNVLPLRAGDVLRAFGFTAWLGQGGGAVLATLLVERLLDLLTLLLAMGLALLWFDLGSGSVGRLLGVGAWGMVAMGAVVLALLLAPRVLSPLLMATLGLARFVSPNLEARLASSARNILLTLSAQAKGPRMAHLVAFSALAWACEGLVFYCVALAIPSLTQPSAAFLALPVGTLSTLVPSTPGYVGTFDFFVLQAMQLGGNAVATATAFALLVHLVLWLPATLVGGVCFAALQARGAIARRSTDPQIDPEKAPPL